MYGDLDNFKQRAMLHNQNKLLSVDPRFVWAYLCLYSAV